MTVIEKENIESMVKAMDSDTQKIIASNLDDEVLISEINKRFYDMKETLSEVTRTVSKGGMNK